MQAKISGKVFNMHNEPLEGAFILILNFKYQSISDQKGEFEMNNIPQGNYKMAIKYLGYEQFFNKLKLRKIMKFLYM
jgi:iron complex outermembrane receptor protein